MKKYLLIATCFLALSLQASEHTDTVVVKCDTIIIDKVSTDKEVIVTIKVKLPSDPTPDDSRRRTYTIPYRPCRAEGCGRNANKNGYCWEH